VAKPVTVNDVLDGQVALNIFVGNVRAGQIEKIRAAPSRPPQHVVDGKLRSVLRARSRIRWPRVSSWTPAP
jgi:hypothetical protein